jgi:hypothetical protein
MIFEYEVMRILMDVCPTFKIKWEEHLTDIWDRNSETILYTDLLVFAKHLCELTKNNNFNNFKNIFDKIEYLLQNGDVFVINAIVVGFLEDYQNCLLNNGYDLNIIDKYLNAETKKNWSNLKKLWNGEITNNNN